MARTERESDNRRTEKKWQTCWCCRDQQRGAEWRRLQRKNLNILGLPKKKEWPQCHSESSWQERHSRLFQKEKEQSFLSKALNRMVGENQGEREAHLGEKEEEQGGSMERKLVDSSEGR